MSESIMNSIQVWISGVAALCFACLILCAPALAGASEGGAPAGRLWKPVPDDVYEQEVGGRIVTEKPVTAVAIYGNAIYAVVDGGVKIAHGGQMQPAPGAPQGVKRLKALAGALWATTADAVFRFADGAWNRVDDRAFVDLCVHLGGVYGATSSGLYRYDAGSPSGGAGAGAVGKFVDAQPQGGWLSNDTTLLREDFTVVHVDPVNIGPIERIASYSGTLYLLRPGSIALLQGKTFVEETVDWGALPSQTTRDMIAQGSKLYISTDRGVGVLRGMALTTLKGSDGLPYEDTTCLAPGFDGDLWIGTTRGAIRKVGNEYQYFGASNWLPADRVNAIAASGRTVAIATDGGLATIRYEPYTLQKKAAYYERELDEWGFKRIGFINPIWRAPDGEWIRSITDNDGGNTARYLTAMSFKYAVTGDEHARAEALDAFEALEWLGTITGKPGFIARAIWSVKADRGMREQRSGGGLQAKWNPTADGNWLWKGDTSSDEVDAHYYAVSIFHDLAAKGDEKTRARDHIAKMSSYIADNGWLYMDVDGKPTRWGRWDPKYLETPYGASSAGLNGMEAQMFAVTALALTGDARYERDLQQLLKWHYDRFTVRQKVTFPPDDVVPWDDNLAWFSYYPLIKYAKDPDLRSIYLRSLDRSWEVLRLERCPFFNFIYGGLTGNDCEAPEAVETLRQWPLDLVNYHYANSHRADLAPQPGYKPILGMARCLPARETGVSWASDTYLVYDGGGNGNSVDPPAEWLESYWMGRYFGMIQAPTSNDPAATHLEPRGFKRHGAKAYDGPPRPAAKG
jgi:hypothetical protein